MKGNHVEVFTYGVMKFSEVYLYILSQNNELLTPSFANGIHCVDIFEFADALFQPLFKAVSYQI